MKTEEQLKEHLEKIINQMDELTRQIPMEENKEVPDDVRYKLIACLGSLTTLAWVLDQESELQPILRACQFVGIADRLNLKEETV